MKKIEKLFQLYKNNPIEYKSIDIHQHLETLKKYGEEVEVITEMGVRWGASTIALANSYPKKLTSYDIVTTKESTNHTLILNEELENYKFIQSDSIKVEIEETDILFIDTLHTYNQLISELNKHSHKVKNYIILHDTETYGLVDENIYNHASSIIKNQNITKKGLLNAIDDFLKTEEGTKWEIHEVFKNNNGLTILKRKLSYDYNQ